MPTTTDYGSWYRYAGTLAPQDTVSNFVSGGTDEWVAALHASGQFDDIVSEFRREIADRLPDGVTLDGDRFHGPHPYSMSPDQMAAWERFEATVGEIIEAIDLADIVRRHDRS